MKALAALAVVGLLAACGGNEDRGPMMWDGKRWVLLRCEAVPTVTVDHVVYVGSVCHFGVTPTTH